VRARFLAALVALALGSGTAEAGEKSAEVQGVRVTVSSSWPTKLNRGWQPLAVRIESSRDVEATLSLSFRNGNGPVNDTITRTVTVPPHGVERFEIAAPARPFFQNSYDLSIRWGGQQAYLPDVGAEESCIAANRIVLVASRDGATTVDVARWGTGLSKESEARVPADAQQQLRSFGYVGRPTATAKAGSTPAAPENVIVGTVSHAALSALPEAYTSLHALVLDPAGDAPQRPALDAIESWLRAGGVVAVYGSGAETFVASEPALSAWTEPRFVVDESDGVATYACGLGLLLVGESPEPMSGDGETAQVAALNAAIERLAPLDQRAPRSAFELEIPGIDVPFRPLTVLLVLFAILVGPVNLIFVRRSKRPALLLLTIPAIALVFSLGLVAYGALAQGLDVRVASQSRGVLDQRTHQGSVHERRVTFAGLAWAGGVQPGPGVVVQREEHDRFDWSNMRDYQASYGETLELGGAWLPVRNPTGHYVTVDRAARARVDVKRGADGWTVTNRLGAPIRDLMFRDAAGDLYRFRGPIAPGRAATAEAAGPDSSDLDPFDPREVVAAPLHDGRLPRGTWIARVEASPLLDACGIEYEELAGDHVILGVLDLAEAR
jgi:hypothetical protein